jgi:hypothetical protein
MTANRDLKRRVRDRQAQTGESYMTALQRVLAQRPSGIPSGILTVEFVDLTEFAASLGVKCRVSASPGLAHSVDLEQTLSRFLEMLVTTQQDQMLSLMRAVVLRGEQIQVEVTPASAYEGPAFIRRLQAGVGGVSANGRMVALRAVPRSAPPAGRGSDELGQFIEVLHTGTAGGGSQPVAVDAPIVVFSLWLAPTFLLTTWRPLLIAMLLDEIVNDPLIDLVRELRGNTVRP